MLKSWIFLSFLGLFVFSSNAQTLEDIYQDNRTFTHKELILKYMRLEKEFPGQCKLLNAGEVDCGRHLHTFVINKNGQFSPDSIDRTKETVLLINNAIHPGEPCGVDACVKMARTWLREGKIPDKLTLVIIPMYNIGGGTNRSCCSRANQNGPDEYGFRGNARNLDLNRDFIKMDSKNAFSFVEIFRQWDPNVFVDTHTSNGADYQHVMTLITTQTDKLGHLGKYVKEEMTPVLYKNMSKSGYDMVPYMHGIGKTPDEGIQDYLETPRYSTGYAAQFNCIGYVTEAHMLKPYKERVEATYEFLQILGTFMSSNSKELIAKRDKARYMSEAATKVHPINYELDTTVYDSILFKGYTAKYKTSEVTGQQRLYYDRDASYEKYIPYYNTYQASQVIEIPKYYIVPQAWKEVIQRLELNKVEMHKLEKDDYAYVRADYIVNYETSPKPYEGHYLHKNVELESKNVRVKLYAGDVLVYPKGDAKRFVIETLDARCVDSYFNWNFFDEILMQKEWFSPYVFEDKAVNMLKENPELKSTFEEKKKNDPEFAKSAWAQLYFLYTQSDNYESSHNRLPVYKVF